MSNANQKRKRPSKKTEMLEVRVSPEEKAAFLNACRNVGRSASEVIRDAMRAYSDFGPMTRLPRSGFVLISAFIGAALGATSLVYILQTETAEDANSAIAYRQFRDIDFNGNDQITREEFLNHAGDLEAILAVGEVAPPPAMIKRASVIGKLFLEYDINTRGIIIDSDELGEACLASASEFYRQSTNDEFNRLDRDLDGLLTSAEYALNRREIIESSFHNSDLDGDGFITYADARQQAIEAENNPPPTPRGEGFRTPEPDYIIACREDIGAWNGDGRTPTAQEALGPDGRWALHRRWDSNGDSRVDFSEYATRFAGL